MILQMHKLEYFYSLHSKIKSFYNFTKTSKIKVWWFYSIFMKIFLFKQINEQKKYQMSIPCYQTNFLFYNLNISFSRLGSKNAKECYA